MFSFFKQYTLEDIIKKECTKFLMRLPNATLWVGIFQNGKKTIQYFWKATPVDHPTFEIGSITKIFTNIILSYFLKNKCISLDSTLSEILGNTYNISPILWNITIKELSTHTSGIPSFPEWWVNNIEDFEIFTEEFNKLDLIHFLETTQNIWKRWKFSYSNLWVAILGFCLETVSHESLDLLYKKYIFWQLNMDHSGIEIHKNIDGHSQKWEKKWYINWWDWTLIGAWWISSNVEDMLVFMEANFWKIDYISHTHEKQPNTETGLGWMLPSFIDKFFGNKNIIWHDGATPGFSSYIVLDIENKIGLVLLMNQYTTLNFLGIMIMRIIRKRTKSDQNK